MKGGRYVRFLVTFYPLNGGQFVLPLSYPVPKGDKAEIWASKHLLSCLPSELPSSFDVEVSDDPEKLE